jgi:hypothetical protein
MLCPVADGWPVLKSLFVVEFDDTQGAKDHFIFCE